METIVRKVDPANPDPEVIREAGEILRRGELVAFPTETVYGLGADGLNPEASGRIYAAKGRPSDNPLIIHISDFEALERITADLPPAAKKLADAFWPGPLTMIFQKSAEVPYTTSGGLDTVAVRMPSHPVAREMIRAGGGYIAAPSANLSGRPSPTTAAHVYEDMAGRIPLILDGGPVGIGLESTIIDLSVEIPMVLRPGYITRQMLAEQIGTVVDDPGLSEESDRRPKAPGMRYRHYAPKAALTLVEGESGAVIRRINALAAEQEAEGKRCGVICTDETKEAYRASVVKTIGSREDEEEIAHNLYAILREFDAIGVDRIYSESFETPRMGQAIMNRLLKAAGHQVISADQ